MIDSDWGPWIEHYGKGCPIRPREIVHVVMDPKLPDDLGDIPIIDRGEDWVVILGGHGGDDGSWFWRPDYFRVIRYRVKRPKGMAILREIAANPKARVPA